MAQYDDDKAKYGGQRAREMEAARTAAPAPSAGSRGSTQGPLGATWNGLGTVGTKESINAQGGSWYRDGNGNWVQTQRGTPNTNKPSRQSQQLLGGYGSSVIGSGGGSRGGGGAYIGGGAVTDWKSVV